MLILEDYWERNAELRGVPIYQASGLARRALTVFQAYIEMMNADIKAAFDQVGAGGARAYIVPALVLHGSRCCRAGQCSSRHCCQGVRNAEMRMLSRV